MIETLVPIGMGVVIGLVGLSGIRIVTPKERGAVERFGKYNRYATPGLNWVIPGVEVLRRINISQRMVDAEPQEIITKDKLNAIVDAQVYFQVKEGENSVKQALYNVDNYKLQIVNLARTTLRNIIGTLTLTQANSERDKINGELMKTLEKETRDWGIQVVRTELKEINPPKDVQETMNKVVKAENEKTAAIDFATSAETLADGKRRAAIKEAEGVKQASILEAEGKAKAFELINKSFVGNAQILKKLDVAENALKSNSKIILPEKTPLTTVIGSLAGLEK